MAFVNYNAWAEVVCAPVDFVYKMPDRMSFAEAAAFSLNFVAAYMMLFEVANLREGMSVLVHSAGGGVVSGKKTAFIEQKKIGLRSFYVRTSLMLQLLCHFHPFRVKLWLSCAPPCPTSPCSGRPLASNTQPSGTP